VFTHGVVMSADSQLVEISTARTGSSVQRHDTPAIRSCSGWAAAVGLVGFAGTEEIEGVTTKEWLRRFIAERSGDDIRTFCTRLADTLTETWKRDELPSVLEAQGAPSARRARAQPRP
jgi:hypothetical protein